MTVPILDGVSSVASRYDAMILDLWGLVHDGVSPYPGVPDCLARLRDGGTRVLLLSNAPRPSATVVGRLREMGIRDDRYERVITSGDLTRDALTRRPDRWHAALGDRCWMIGPERDRGLVEALALELVDGPESADFVLATGLFDDEAEGLGDYAGRLEAVAARSLPMVCANPDLSVVRGDRTVLCAGSLAKAYEELGGDVRYHGKPHPGPYAFCFEVLDGVPRHRILAAGDSLRTDIAGANAAGIDGLFVMGGLHAGELLGAGRDDPAGRLRRMVDESGHRPIGAVRRFAW